MKQRVRMREEFIEKRLPIHIMRYLRKQFETLILAYSGGTDSTLLLLMIKEHNIPIDYIVFNNTKLADGFIIKYIRNIIDKLGFTEQYKITRPSISLKKITEMILEDFNKNYNKKHDKKQYRCCYHVKKKPMVIWLKKNNLDLETTCVLRGIRANESSQRLMTALQLIEKGNFYFFNFAHSKHTKVSDPIRFVGESAKQSIMEKLCSKYNIPYPETSGCMICPIFYKYASEEEKRTRRYQITKKWFERNAKVLITSYMEAN